MTLSASMWTSVSGLLSHSEKMNVVGNNLANVSTLGFKSQRMDFEDYMYVGKGAASGTEQVGQGAGIYTILGDFSQGSLQSTNSATDLAIEGNGFFGVRQTGTEQIYYTRAGDFYFNTERQLQNPAGQIVQGWSIETTHSIGFMNGSASINSSKKNESPYVGTGVSKDIVLDSWNLIPQRTTNVSVTNSLVNSDDYDYTTYAADAKNPNPCAALFNRWDGTQDVPLAEGAYATQSTVDVYDASGGKHNLTIYMDRVNTENDNYSMEGLPSGYSVYEYLVTMPPSEDKRTYGGTYNVATQTLTKEQKFADTKMAGVLMTGVLVFNASGQLVNQSAYTYGAQQSSATDASATANTVAQYGADPALATSWQPTKFSSNGLPVFAANFTGQALASTVSDYIGDGNNNNYPSEDCIIELDFGLQTAGGWQTAASSDGTATTTAIRTLGDATVTDAGVFNFNNIALMNESTAIRDNDATACNGNAFTTRISSDGYASGVLSGYNIDTDGVIYGTYSNGESIPLYQISLYDFTNTQGLYREGGNLYSATTDSGPAREGVAGDGLFGQIKSYNIEQSNVDMTTEFVQMISTQRGFQANSKTITTVDTMLETVINMKR